MPNRMNSIEQPIQVESDSRHITPDLSGLKSLPFTPTLVGGMQIPFASGNTTVKLNSNLTTGGFNQVMLIGFGGSSPLFQTVTGSQAYPTLGGSFSMNSSSDIATSNAFFFSFPCDILITGIDMVVSSGGTQALEGTVFACVALATATAVKTGYPNFTILKETQTSASGPFVKGGNAGVSVSFSGETTGLSTLIPAGQLITIVCGLYTADGKKAEENGNLNYSGCITYSIPEYALQ